MPGLVLILIPTLLLLPLIKIILLIDERNLIKKDTRVIL
jgi:hypothetical protein